MREPQEVLNDFIETVIIPAGTLDKVPSEDEMLMLIRFVQYDTLADVLPGDKLVPRPDALAVARKVAERDKELLDRLAKDD